MEGHRFCEGRCFPAGCSISEHTCGRQATGAAYSCGLRVTLNLLGSGSTLDEVATFSLTRREPRRRNGLDLVTQLLVIDGAPGGT